MTIKNQLWAPAEKIFDGNAHGLCLKVSIMHGGTAQAAGWGQQPRYIPTTWGRIIIMPKASEDVVALVQQIGSPATELYEDRIERVGSKIRADKYFRLHGIDLGINIRTLLPEEDGALHTPQDVMDALTAKLGFLGKPLDQKTAAPAIRKFLDKNLSQSALNTAQEYFVRTGGGPSGPSGCRR